MTIDYLMKNKPNSLFILISGSGGHDYSSQMEYRKQIFGNDDHNGENTGFVYLISKNLFSEKDKSETANNIQIETISIKLASIIKGLSIPL